MTTLFRNPTGWLAAAWPILLAGTFAAAAQEAPGNFQAPNFDAPLFERDALSLDDAQRTEIISALVALARNFPNSDLVDADLREKALALALNLAPLDKMARDAVAELSAGRTPGKVDFFGNSTPLIEALWHRAETLSAAGAEPEDQKLASYLMELALIFDARPLPARMARYASYSKRHPADWSGVVSLQPTLHPSNERVATVLRQGAAYRVQTPSPPASRPGNAGNRAGTNIPMPVAPGGSAVSEPKRAKVSLSALVFDDAGKHAFGEAKLEIREVRAGDATTIFGVSGDLESLKQTPFQLKRAPGSLFTIGGAETALALARSALGDDALPAGHLGLFDFSAREGEAGPAIDLSLPLALMLEAAMKDQTPGEGIVVAGGVSPEGNLLPNGMVAGLASTVTGFDHEGLLLVPAGAATALRGAIASDNLTVLVKPQIAAAQSIDQARAAVFPPENQKLREAVELFSQVERDDIRAQMTLKDLAANARVQDQLRQVLAAWPDHLSAKLMLEFGTNPSAFQIGIDASVAMVDAALRPVEEYYRSLDSGGVIIGAHEALIDKASTDLRDCRSKVNDAAKGVVSAGERTLDAFKAYLTLTNRSTSIASQRLRELNDAVNAYQTERLKVGISTDPFAH